MPASLAYEDSRRLTGYNLYFADVGAALETVGIDIDDAFVGAWEARVRRMRADLGWPDAALVARVHASGASLAFAAPLDQLLTATEVNEWALLSSLFSLPEKIPAAQPPGLFFSPWEKMPEGQTRERHADAAKKLPFDEETLAFVRALRQSTTDAERLLWALLRNRRVLGQKFRRQHAAGPYVLDFYCHELMLAIELDGGQHNETENAARDARRDAFFAERGMRTLRFWNDEVLGRTEDVLAAIWECAGRGTSAERATSDAGGPPSSALRAPSPGGRRDELHAPGHPAAWDVDCALHTLSAFARAERNPQLVALVRAARARGLTVLIDEEAFSVGVGRGSQSWPMAQLPALVAVDWAALHDVPVALVTGSNGKTTTTRLLAAFTRAHGWRTAYTCTDGVFVGASQLAAGDYSGPGGARVALRAAEVDAAILETARGGLLRRGIAVQHADVAVVTNVSDDHFGEYGVHDLDDLAAVKLTVARTLGEAGTLVLNADDPSLLRHAPSVRVAWFALDADAPLLQAQRARGGATCGVRNGHLHLQHGEGDHDLGAVATMPLTFNGAARYNIGNIAAAALAAHALGIAAAAMRDVLANFGGARDDNPGRLQHWSLGGISVFVDYAHNPDGLRGLLDVATRSRSARLGLLLGQAGNREDAELRELAAVAAEFRPDLIVLKEIGGMLRGRTEGEVPALLRDELARHGLREPGVIERLDEYQAVRDALAWAREGDLLVLPIHGSAVKPQVDAFLDTLQARGWMAGTPFPAGDG